MSESSGIEALFAHLERLQIKTQTYEHAPLATVAQSQSLRGRIAGGHCKNLFLRDVKGELYLLVCLEEARVDLKALAKAVGAKRFSFGSAARLEAALGVQPGSVTPFALMNDKERHVRPILDREMLGYETLNYHPLVNDKTTSIGRDDLLRFIESTGHEALIIDLPCVAQV